MEDTCVKQAMFGTLGGRLGWQPLLVTRRENCLS